MAYPRTKALYLNNHIQQFCDDVPRELPCDLCPHKKITYYSHDWTMYTKDNTDLCEVDPGKHIPSVGQEISFCFSFEMKPVAPTA